MTPTPGRPRNRDSHPGRPLARSHVGSGLYPTQPEETTMMATHDMPAAPEVAPGVRDYWQAVTDVPCPRDGCGGTVRWAEAGHVPGWRLCDGCGREYQADGSAEHPTLVEQD